MSIKITEEGKTLLEDAILQDKKVVFSQIELIADVEKSPTEMVKRVDVSKVSASDYNTITVQAQIDNDGFLDTYYFNRANVYADEVLFAYDDGINICIPAETTKVINDLEMMMKIDSAVADLKIIYEGYVLRKDFDDMESKIQKINTTIKDMEANAVTQNDCTDQVSWNSQIVKKEFLTIGNMAFFRATGGFSTSRGSIVLATIPQGYFPETTRNQSSYELMGVFTSAYDKERRNCYVTLNCLSGNVDLQINNNEAYSDTRSDDNVQMIFYGFWKMNAESQGGTGGSISYREDIEKLRQSIQDSKKEIVRSSREIDSLKEDLSNKITKFYASNQGETHIADSDNGKIQDMMIYGKSSQNGTPTPENPVEIKSVVNPTVKVCGKNLWNPILGGYISGNDGSIVKGLKTQIAVTDFIKTSGKDITVIARNFSSAIECSYAYRIGLYNAEKKWIKNIFPSGGNKYSINTFNITGTEYIRVSAPSGIYNTIQIEKGSEATPYEPYTEQSVQLPYTLNAIPVTSGGNVTIDGQQYIADYVDTESGKYVQKIQTDKVQSNLTWQIQKQPKGYSLGYLFLYKNGISTQELGMKNAWKSNMGDSSQSWSNGFSFGRSNVFWIVPYKNDGNITSDDINAWLVEHPMDIMYPLAEPIETDLTPEEIEAFKGLVTNYPVTNVSITSDQLDGYTVFNYPISMAEGWNYIKQQLNDNRDYIYDMDAKAQDIDTQAAEAYVNSEYAVALTELEV